MRILFFIGPFPLPSETFILNQITGLIDRGHEVRIYATQKTAPSTLLHQDVNQYRLFQRTRFRRTFKGRISSRLGRYRLACELAMTHPNLLSRAYKLSQHVKRIPAMTLIADVKSLIDKPAYDIIHCHFGFHGNRAMLLREIGVLQGKLITTFHAVDLTVTLNESGNDLYDRLFQQGDLFMPISRRWQQRLIELGCDARKIRVHHMGIDCRRFAFKPRQPANDGIFRIVSVARLVGKKGIAHGIRAVARLKKECAGTDIEYTVVGDGPLRGDLERLVSDLGAGDCVRMVGWQEQHQVVGILDRSDVFLAPSVTDANDDQEGIPVALMEAMAMGMPVVTTRHSGIPELVDDGVSGFLLPEKDVDGLFEKLKFLAENPQQWAEMGQQGRKTVEAHYDINRLNDQLVDIYRSICS